jgi:hypothetical protein
MFKMVLVHVFGGEESHPLIALFPFFGLDVSSTDAQLIGIAKWSCPQKTGHAQV